MEQSLRSGKLIEFKRGFDYTQPGAVKENKAYMFTKKVHKMKERQWPWNSGSFSGFQANTGFLNKQTEHTQA